MFSKVMIALASTAAAVNALPSAPTYGHPAPAPTYGHPAPVTYKDETPKPYAFEYGVHDDYAGTNFAQNENADGSTASGSYSVLLPDGRTQTVTYHADQAGYGGYVADVKYEGVAQYPEYKPAVHPAPAPVYHAAPAPAPVYHPAPAPAPVYHPAPAPVYHPAPAPTYHA